jgi:hypothetical protein
VKTYKIEIEIVLKDYPEIDDDRGNWIHEAIEQQLETGEFIDYFFIEDMNRKPLTEADFKPMTEVQQKCS